MDHADIDHTGLTGVGGANLQSAAYTRSTGDYTTTSGTFVDVDATNMAFTFTTGARRVMLAFAGSGYNTTVNSSIRVTVAIDGTDVPDLVWHKQLDTGGENVNLSFTYITDVLAAASHTFKLRFCRGTSGTATISGSQPVARFAAVELLA